MDKVWIRNYTQGVPAEIDPDKYSSLVVLFEDCCQRYRHLPAFYNLGTTLTYDQIDQLSYQCAAYFQQELKLKPGDRVAIMLPNLLQYPILVFAALRAGLIVVNVNPLYKAAELIHQLNDSGACTLIVLENFAHTVQQAQAQLTSLKQIIITRVGDLLPTLKGQMIHFVLKYIKRAIPCFDLPQALYFKDMLQTGKKHRLTPVTVATHDVAFLQYTGGTTGISKGAMLTHRNLIANLLQAESWFQGLLEEGKEIAITALPLYHIFSLTANGLFVMKMGGLNVLITNPRDIKNMLKDMARFKFSVMTGVNTLFNALIKQPTFKKLDFSHLKITLGGGMAVQKIVAEQWQAMTKVPLLEAYGLTEASPCVTINPSNLQAYNGSIGLPVPSTEVAILDAKQNELAIDEVGELAVKGPQVMKGYWQQEEETAKVFTKSGWLLTGDIASINREGFIFLLERKKDMILVSGFNVYPNELENVIASLDGVQEVAVIGVPDEVSGEVPKAFIVKNDPNLTAEKVIAYCRKFLTGYKVPKSVAFLNELPKTNVGKILRRALK